MMMTTTADPRRVLGQPQEGLRIELAKRAELHPSLHQVESAHVRSYGWELHHFRLTSNARNSLYQDWDFLPVLPQADHRQAIFFENVFRVFRLQKYYKNVVLLMPPEVFQELKKEMKHCPCSKWGGYFYRRADNDSDSLKHHLKDPNGTKGAMGAMGEDMVYLEPGSPELIALGQSSPLDLEKLQPLSLDRLTLRAQAQSMNQPSEQRHSTDTTGLHFFPPANGFVPWLDAWALHTQKSQEFKVSSQVESDIRSDFKLPHETLKGSLRFAGAPTLFLCGWKEFYSLIQFAENFDQDQQENQGSDSSEYQSRRAQDYAMPNFSFLKARRKYTIYQPSIASQIEFSSVLPLFLRNFTDRTLHDSSHLCNGLYTPRYTGLCPDVHRDDCLRKLIESTSQNYEKWTKTTVSPTHLRNFQRYLGKLLASENSITPRAFDLLLAARSCVDGNFSYELAQELLRKIETKIQSLTQTGAGPKNMSRFATLDLRLSDVFTRTTKIELKSVATFEHLKSNYGSNSAKKTKFKQLNTAQFPMGADRDHLKNQNSEALKGQYANGLWVNQSNTIQCSFPSEDLTLDASVASMTRRAKSRLKEKAERSISMESGLEDGLNLRETIRQWHTEKIFVNAFDLALRKELNAVVFDFTQSPQDDRAFDWKALWHAEAHDATHLMFYATHFKHDLVGPGIARSTFGGFAAVAAHLNVSDLWSHPYLLHEAHSLAEHLLLAAAFSIPDDTLVVVSHRLPTRRIIEILGRNNRKIVHIPLREIDQNMLRKMRTFHVLAEAGVRNYAHQYIKKDESD